MILPQRATIEGWQVLGIWIIAFPEYETCFGIPNPLNDDASSLAFVQAKANEGSAYHTEALMITQL